MHYKKPNSIEIRVWDRKENKAKSFTVYDTTVDEVFEIVKKVIEQPNSSHTLKSGVPSETI